MQLRIATKMDEKKVQRPRNERTQEDPETETIIAQLQPGMIENALLKVIKLL